MGKGYSCIYRLSMSEPVERSKAQCFSQKPQREEIQFRLCGYLQ